MVLVDRYSIAAHKQALADRAAGRPSAYDIAPALLASIKAASARKNPTYVRAPSVAMLQRLPAMSHRQTPTITKAQAMELKTMLKDGRPRAALAHYNTMSGSNGVEWIGGTSGGLYYVNHGDTYNTTLIYDTGKQSVSVGSWGDIVERDRRFRENPKSRARRNPGMLSDYVAAEAAQKAASAAAVEADVAFYLQRPDHWKMLDAALSTGNLISMEEFSVGDHVTVDLTDPKTGRFRKFQGVVTGSKMTAWNEPIFLVKKGRRTYEVFRDDMRLVRSNGRKSNPRKVKAPASPKWVHTILRTRSGIPRIYNAVDVDDAVRIVKKELMAGDHLHQVSIHALVGHGIGDGFDVNVSYSTSLMGPRHMKSFTFLPIQ